MIRCPKCNKELEDGTQFCDSCGAQIFETIFCPNCGKQTSTEFTFCQSCGASLGEKPAEDQSVTITETSESKKKPPQKAIIFGGIGVAIVAVLILVISLFTRGKAENNFALYVKDKEIFCFDFKDDSKAWQVTSRLLDTKEKSENDFAYLGSDLGVFTYISKDGKYIFFPDKIIYDDKGLNLYYREIGKPKVEAIKIDSDIYSYTVNTSTTLVTYIKGEEGSLYQYKISEDSKDKIASEVEGFKVSADGNKIVYINSEGSIYLKYAGKDKEKIAEEVSSIKYLSEDFKTVYYIKDNSLYKQVEGEDKFKIASDVYKVIKIYDSGEVYYLKSNSEVFSPMDYVIDDMKDSDSKLIMPKYPSPPSWRDYNTIAAYEVAYKDYQIACKVYESDYDAYKAKRNRDSIRKSLKEETLNESIYTLYFFNGTEEAAITDSFNGEYSYNYTVADDVAVISYEAYNQSKLKKVKLSEIDAYNIRAMFTAALHSSSERYIAIKSIATIVEQEKDVSGFKISADGTMVYYIEDIPEGKTHGELYRICIKDGVVGKSEVYDSDVYSGSISFVDGSKLKYFKNCKDMKGDLYIDRVKIDYDVYLNNVKFYSDLNKILFFSDSNIEKGYGTLKFYQDGKSVKIADDVHDFSVTPDGRLLYLYDYSPYYYKGELREWYNGKTRNIADDVTCIITIHNGKYRGRQYDR